MADARNVAVIAAPAQKLAYSIEDFCAAIGISRAHIYRLARKGQLRMVRLGSRTVIPATEAVRLLSPETASTPAL